MHQKTGTDEPIKKKWLFPNSFWISKKDEKRNHKRNNTPCKRWGHSVILFENQMFLFGGSGNNSNARNWETIYILNCETYEWEKVCPNDALGTNTPEPRDSHACVRIGNNMYIFGGSNGENPLNDMFAFNLVSKTWNKIDTIGEIPSPREGHSGVALLDRYFFIFGGWDGKNIFQNCYLFDYITKRWKLVEYVPGSEPLPRESHSCALLHDSIYIFGGQGTSVKKKDTYYNDLFRFKINIDKSLEKVSGAWEKLSSKNGTYPSPRTSHSIISYKDRFLIVIGGEGYSSNNEFVEVEENKFVKENGKHERIVQNREESDEDDDDDHPPCFPKSDIWIYDIEDYTWNLLDVKNSELFMPRFTHSCSVYKDCLIIFGGLKDFKNSIDDLMVLSLEDNEPNKPIHLCSCCKKILNSEHNNEEHHVFDSEKIGSELKKIETITEEIGNEIFEYNTNSKPFISLSYLPKIIKLISWPFAAFGLFIDNALLIDAKEVKIHWEKKFRCSYNPGKVIIKDKEHLSNFLVVEYSGNFSCFNEKIRILDGFLNFTESSFEEEQKNSFFNNLKYAGLRLGDVIFFVAKRDKIIELFYMSTNLRTNPDINDYIVFNCSWNFETKEKFSPNFLQNKKSIFDNISHLLTEQELLDLPANLTLFIFSLKKVPLQNKNNLLYEINYNLKNDDICLLMPKIRENPHNDNVYYSLRQYLEYFYLNPPNHSLEIFLNSKKIDFADHWKDIFYCENSEIVQDLKFFSKKFKILAEFYTEYSENCNTEKKEEPFKQGENNAEEVNRNSINLEKNLKWRTKECAKKGLLLYQNNRLIKKLDEIKIKRSDCNFKNQGSSLIFYGYIELVPEITLDFSKSVNFYFVFQNQMANLICFEIKHFFYFLNINF